MAIIHLIHRHIWTPIRGFIQDSRAVGIILLGCTLISLVLSNLGFSTAHYLGFWQTHWVNPVSFLHLPSSSLEMVNDVLMSVFFFLVGMEIKRELTIGELASVKKSMLPILAALGGMVVPALIFFLFNGQTPYHHGWGIPMATDIAFSLGILSLLGNKVPVQLKIFLTALAIIDDLGAVITIAVFYTSDLHFLYLIGAGLAVIALIAMNLFKVRRFLFFLIPGLILWYCLFNSGVHATISGVILSLCVPLGMVPRLEKWLTIPVNFVILPLFALANTAILLPHSAASVFGSTVSLGIILGLVIGKPVGIFLFSYLSSKAGIAQLPSRTELRQLFGVGMLGGIGFTMSIFTTTLAFSLEGTQVISKVSIMAGSLISAIIGFTYLSRYKPAIRHQLSQATLSGEVVPQEEYQPSLEPVLG